MIKTTMVTAAAATVLLAAAGCGAGTRDADPAVPLPAPSSTTQQVAAENFGHLWPLSVDHGTIECRPGTQAVFVTADGTEYALNGKAEQAGIRSVDDIRAQGSGAGDVSTGALLTQAMKLC
ncbi:hypothetical protein GCM10010168_09660 [Actinoplanes ianthinogenes]|uniref:DUF2511 domain-containing protein n=1 Tax=Actinoplanes ianthinogenes TaxID=122358 RepID=A0ABN6CI45_9ACTN|nr:DUF2511 domain-containing protein [Actinoplanes ianthinogenes]BCJ44153.1 hypothetical protein Aiant_48100 [Actinoplanes ianthinogenes]GGQ96120.1 hypothetical protein GCM10010168_09660 [Actinoplanes ianthinogenes]